MARGTFELPLSDRRSETLGVAESAVVPALYSGENEVARVALVLDSTTLH